VGVGQEAKEEKKADKLMEIAYSGKDDKKRKPLLRCASDKIGIVPKK